jgi:hypothetical protein
VVAAIGRLLTKMNAEWGNIKYWVLYHWNKIKETIGTAIDAAKELVRKAMERIQQFIDGIKTSTFVKAINTLITKLEELYELIRKAAKLLNINLPALGGTTTTGHPDFQFGGKVKAGQPSVVGEHNWEMFVPYANGMILNQRQIAHVISAAASQMSGGTMPYLHRMLASPKQAGTTVVSSKQVNFNFGGVVIANEMDMVTFEARVRNVVRQEFS